MSRGHLCEELGKLTDEGSIEIPFQMNERVASPAAPLEQLRADRSRERQRYSTNDCSHLEEIDGLRGDLVREEKRILRTLRAMSIRRVLANVPEYSNKYIVSSCTSA